MAIKGATFDLQTVLAKYDGAMYNALSNNHDGYVSWTGSGNPITFTDTNVLTLKNGYILIHGRLIVVDGATDITLNPGSSISSGDGRLVLQIDTSKTNTQTVLNQVEILQEYKATSASWRTLSTDDINALHSGVYEVQLCHFTVSNGTSSGVQIDISTDTIIGNLQDDIETLADNLEQTASDVGDLQIPNIVQFYIDKSSYSRSGYSNLQITTRTNISGDTSFTNANTDYWNIQLNPGIYRMNLYCSFQSSSAVTTDVGIGLGNNANRRATPIEARVQTTGSLTKLNASGILKVTSYNDLYSFLIYMGDSVARDIGGYWTIERIGK